MLQSSDEPLSFLVTVPSVHRPKRATDRCYEGFLALKPHLVDSIEVEANAHVYQMGQQHRPTAHGTPYWTSAIASTAYLWQNAAGSARWPVRNTFAAALRRAWSCSVAGSVAGG